MTVQSIRIVMVEDNHDDAEIVGYFLMREGLNCEIERVDTHSKLEATVRPRSSAT